MRTWKLPVLLLVVAVAAAGYFIFRPRMDEREKIVRALVSAAGAVEREDVRGALTCVSDDYHDAAGLSKRALTLLALQARAIEGDVRVPIAVTGVTINDDRAEALADVTVRVVDSAGTHELFQGTISFALRKEKRGRWRVVESEGWQHTLELEQGF